MKLTNAAGGRQQAGFSIIKIILIVGIVSFLGQILVRSMPGWAQYSKIKVAIVALESSGDTDVDSVRKKFDARASIDSITAITGKDLDITTSETGPQIHYTYSYSVPLFGNASIVYDFSR
jgi:type II secretory pathway pseudopilin PulG